MLDNIDTMIEDKIIEKLIELEEAVKQSSSKAEIAQFRAEQTMFNDQLLTIVKRIDEERYATIAWIRRVEEEAKEQKKITQSHEGQIQKIKQELKLAT